jgi:hypothetical protein
MIRRAVMVDNKDMQTEYDIFADVWKFYKSCYDLPNNTANWNKIIQASHEIEHKYESQLCNDLLIAVVMELERKYINESEETK